MLKRSFSFAAVAWLTVVLGVVVLGQTPADPPKPPKPENAVPTPTPGCPKLDIKTINQPVREGVPVEFTATLAGGDPKIPATYDWYLSAGVINRGQGTPKIEVYTNGAGAERGIIANLLVGGFPPDCVMSASASAIIAGPAQKVDEFGEVAEEEETARIDRFRSFMAPTDYGYVFGYAGRKSVRGLAVNNLKRMRAYFIKVGVPLSNIIFVDGGYREEAAHEFWLVQKGAEPPRASPTIDAKEIVFPKVTPPKRKP